jgi:hypothetical protein
MLMKPIPLVLYLFMLAGCSAPLNNTGLTPTSLPVTPSGPIPARVSTTTPSANPSATITTSPQSPSTPSTATPLISPLLLPAQGARPQDITAKIEWKGNPAQPYLLLQGTLANSCQDWAIYVNPPDEQSLIVVSAAVDTSVSTGTCSENPVPVQREVLLGPFNPGQYTVYLNDSRIGDLTIK